MRWFWLLCGAVGVLGLGCGGNTAGQRGTDSAGRSAGGAGSLAGNAGVATAGQEPVAGGDDGGMAGATSNEAGAGGAGGAPPDEARPYRALQIATGNVHTCALLENQRVKCWGANFYGQLGLELPSDAEVGLDPTQMGDALPFVDLGTGRTAKAIAAGRYTTCAILDDDSVKCWGLNLFSQPTESTSLVGDAPGEMGDALPPLPLGPGRTAQAVGIGHYQACVARDDGSFFCGGTSDDKGVVMLGVGGAKLVSMTASRRPLALYDDGKVRAPGSTPNSAPTEVAANVAAMTGGEFVECFLLATSKLDCGSGQFSKLPSEVPGALALGTTNFGNVCAIRSDHSVECWGGQWDQPWIPNAPASAVVPLSQPAVQLSRGADAYQCALLKDGSVECWTWKTGAVAGIGTPADGLGQFHPIDLGTFVP